MKTSHAHLDHQFRKTFCRRMPSKDLDDSFNIPAAVTCSSIANRTWKYGGFLKGGNSLLVVMIIIDKIDIYLSCQMSLDIWGP